MFEIIGYIVVGLGISYLALALVVSAVAFYYWRKQ